MVDRIGGGGGGGVEMSTFLTLLPAVIVLVMLFGLIYALFRTRSAVDDDDDQRKAEIAEMIGNEEGERGDGGVGQRQGGIGRRGVGVRVRRRREQEENEFVPVERERQQRRDVNDDASISDEDAEEHNVAGKGRKKKEANRAAKQERKEAMQAMVKAQREKQERDAERRQLKEEEIENLKREKEEEEELRRAEDEAKKQEEFDKWKDLFTVESAGSGLAEIEEESQGLLAEFKQYVRSHKVIVLEELAARFKLRTDEAINRVTTLEKSGAITGVFDDRGKFIFIETCEMEAVADLINQRGRVSITDLSREAGKLINLTAS